MKLLKLCIVLVFLFSMGAWAQGGASAQGSASDRQIVVISDLHWGEGKDPKTDHWDNKEDFRWPEQFSQFVEQIHSNGKGKTDLIIAGDLFDLWQSNSISCNENRGRDLGCNEAEAANRLSIIVNAHQRELAALGAFARKGDNRLIILPGNHDAALLFPSVRDIALKAIGGSRSVQFLSGGFWLSPDSLIYIDHGHQIGQEVNKWKTWPTPLIEKDGKRYLQRTWGEKFVQDYYNRFESKYPVIDNISSETEGVRYAIAAEGDPQSFVEIAGFVNFFLFEVSWAQFKSALGKEKKGEPPEWNIKAIKEKGPSFLIESIPSDHPFHSVLQENMKGAERKQIEVLFKKLTDDEIKSICDRRAFIMKQQEEKGTRITVAECPRTKGSLGAIAQKIFSSGTKVLGTYLEKDVYPNVQGSGKPFLVYIYGHTHLPVMPTELYLSSGYWKPTIVNSGAWQRVATPDEINAIKAKRNLPSGEVLTGLHPEDLPACYSFVVINPYKKNPRPLLKYWVGEENQKGKIKERCQY